MRLFSLLAGMLVLLVLAAPVSAHHKPGHQGGPKHGDERDGNSSSGRRGDTGRPDRSGPESGPGNSGAAHWCRSHFDDASRGEPFPFKNRGQCVSFFAHGGTLDDDGEGSRGDLRITDVQVYEDGTFRLRGVGAEDRVIASIGGVSGEVVGFGDSTPGSDGSWEIHGEWACRDDDEDHDARFVVRDSDERDRWRASFPCDELDD